MPEVFQPGDSTNALLRKILANGGSGGGGGGGSVVVTSSALPTGAATETTLSAVNTKLAGTLAVSAASLPLPTGAATETTLATLATQATLAALNAKVTAVNTGAVTISSSALPTGAATETTLSAINTKLAGTIATSIADGSDSATGAKANSAATDSTSSWSVISMLKGIYALLNGTGSITVKQSTAANLKVDGSGVTQPVSIAAAVTVQQSTAANLKVDGSGVTQPVSLAAGVGGKMNVIKDTTAVTAAGYSAGNAVGGKRTYANALTSAGTGVLESITLLDRNNQSQPMTVIIFDADPTNATITDKSAFVYSTDDLKVLGQITISASDYITTNSKAIATIRGIGLSLKSAGTSLYVALVTTGTPTFAATTDVQLILGILQD